MTSFYLTKGEKNVFNSYHSYNFYPVLSMQIFRRKEKILIADDESSIRRILETRLSIIGYEVLTAPDGETALFLFHKEHPNLVVLDVMMPKIDGYGVCQEIRKESDIPIIMLTALGDVADRITGLELGADDYVVKPFSPSEVVARVKAQLRRYHQLSEPTNKVEVFSFKDLELDFSAYTVKLNGKYIEFTVKEFESLRFLALHPNQVLSRKQIYENVWGYNEYGDLNTVTIHIKKIREKLEDNLLSPKYIKTVRGIGYKFGGETS